MSITEQVVIVMIEDDEGHARLIEKNLRRGGITNALVHLSTGKEAIDFFFAPNSLSSGAMLVLLDLNLPEVDGYEILRRLKENVQTQNIPVIILTTTDNPKEIDRCYEMGCNVYLVKPVDYEKFAESIRKLGLLLAVVQVPNPKGAI